MSLIEFVKQDQKKNLILFVHGFTGSKDTWKHEDHASFPDLLLENQQIYDNYDVAYFSYFTRLLNLFSKTKFGLGQIIKLLGFSSSKYLTNNSIEVISDLLKTEIRFSLSKYDNIIVIAHSMGGLVTKSCIVKTLQEETPSKIKLFLSLAVPHMGTNAATFGKLISNNLQIKDLAPLAIYTSEINNFWLKTELRPSTKYFYGTQDFIVLKTSAVPMDKETLDTITLNESHTSISKPEGKRSTTLISITEFILNFDNTSEIKYQSLDDQNQYNNELFVLKLIIADIKKPTINDAKEVFLNAEYIRKKFSSQIDQNQLADLYTKIRKLYMDNYSDYLHDGIANSGQLLVKVHKDIIDKDSEFLKSLIPFIDAIHKQGMLHQLANSTEKDIWWSENRDLSILKKGVKN